MAQAIPIALSVGGSLLAAGGQVSSSNAQAGQLRDEAVQLEQMAGQDRASSQFAGAEQRRQARLLQSRALAVAAAQGGASDPTVVNIIADLEAEGEIRALSALFEGEEQARSREMQARARRKEAKNVKKAGLISAAGSVLQAGSTLYQKYG